MIRWLVQSLGHYPELAQGMAPPGMLSAEEYDQLGGLRAPKRRVEWLLGRWTAKRLLQAIVEQDLDLRLPLSAFHIRNDASGAPGWTSDVDLLTGRSSQPDAEPARWDLSISHCDGQAICAVGPLALLTNEAGQSQDRPGIGVDMERVEHRPPGFAEEYFSAAEVDLLGQERRERRDLLTTAIWSAKEAALKALHLGLTVDTRDVVCELSRPSGDSWMRFPIVWAPPALGTGASRQLTGWWRQAGDRVLALATPGGNDSRPIGPSASPVVVDGDRRLRRSPASRGGDHGRQVAVWPAPDQRSAT